MEAKKNNLNNFQGQLATVGFLSLLGVLFVFRRDAMVQSSCYRPPGSIPDGSSPFRPSQCHPPGSENITEYKYCKYSTISENISEYHINLEYSYQI